MSQEMKAWLMTLDKATAALGCSLYSVRRGVNSGEIKSVRLGSRIMVSSTEVERIQREGLQLCSTRGRPKGSTKNRKPKLVSKQ